MVAGSCLSDVQCFAHVNNKVRYDKISEGGDEQNEPITEYLLIVEADQRILVESPSGSLLSYQAVGIMFNMASSY